MTAAGFSIISAVQNSKSFQNSACIPLFGIVLRADFFVNFMVTLLVKICEKSLPLPEIGRIMAN